MRRVHSKSLSSYVADFVCPGGAGSGYPAYSDFRGPEVGRKNLAVFYQSLENFKTAAGWICRRPQPPLLIASTLLVPGYVDEEEVAGIAGFIAGLNPEIPYSLLAFYPRFYMGDLPVTSRAQALRCKAAAEEKGVRQVHIGNEHLL